MQRLAAVAGERWDAVARARRALSRAGRASSTARPRPPQPVARPAPKPPRDARPTRLSVTEIEHWLRDPYTIYAKHILRLRELDAVDLGAGRRRPRHRHPWRASASSPQTFAQALPADPLGELLALGRKHFAALEDFPEARAFWWPRFLRIARWFAGWERERRAASSQTVHAEIRGEIEIPLGERTFTLRARADRIERLADGSYAILDYKTGQVPTEKQVRIGLSPQLTLEAAILRAGGFPASRRGRRSPSSSMCRSRAAIPPARQKPIDFKDGEPDADADHALRKLTAVATRFEDPAHSPTARAFARCGRPRYGDYDHLARVQGMVAAGGDEDEEVRMSKRRAVSRRRAGSASTRRPIPRAVGLGLRQCRLGQDLRAGAARDPAAARAASTRERSSASPSPRPPPPTWRTACSTRWRAGPRSTMPRSTRRSARPATRAPDASAARAARRLFALALETPGGLKVQTIHAFCTRLLQQFPFEANVAARFRCSTTRPNAAARRDQPRRAARRRGRRRTARSAARSRSRSRRRRTRRFRDVVGEAIRKRDEVMAWIEQRRRRRRRDRRAVRRARHRAGRHDRATSRPRSSSGADRCRPNGRPWPRSLRAGLEDRRRPGGAACAAAGARPARNAPRTTQRSSARRRLEPRADHRHRAAIRDRHPALHQRLRRGAGGVSAR